MDLASLWLTHLSRSNMRQLDLRYGKVHLEKMMVLFLVESIDMARLLARDSRRRFIILACWALGQGRAWSWSIPLNVILTTSPWSNPLNVILTTNSYHTTCLFLTTKSNIYC
ncbi:hypothetical protein YC2023_050591 [Brassica napus]